MHARATLALPVAAALAIASHAAAAQTTHRVFTLLQAVHGNSVTGPETSTPDGAVLLVAESAVLAFIDASDPLSYESPLRIEPISSFGVRAVDLMLDPAADLGDSSLDPNDLVYVAGGRMGLWAMQAHPTAGSALAAVRLDDAVDAADFGIQSSRRWCNNLGRIQVGSRNYLLALFAQKSCNKLRAYDLTRARSALASGVDAGEETGYEILPDVEVCLDNCAFIPIGAYHSFAFGLAVDDDADLVYAALGPHGLVRVDFTTAPGSSCPSANVGAGPYFGDGSAYASQCLDPSGVSLYDNFKYIVGPNPTDVGRQDPPYFMDVAIETGATKYLWAAVDHLGLVRFDVTDPLDWAYDMPIDHQEGERIQNDRGEDQIALVVDNPGVTVRTYAHRLSINDAERILALAAHSRPYILSDGILDEGRRVGAQGGTYQGIPPGELELDVDGKYDYTIVYDIDDLDGITPGTCGQAPNMNYQQYMREGGRSVHIPDTGHPAGWRVVFGGHSEPPLKADGDYRQTTFRALFDWTDPPGVTLLEREAKDRPGRNVYSIGYSPTNPEVLFTGANDTGLAIDGILYECDDGIHRLYQPDSAGNDRRGAFGTIFNPFAIWPKGPSDYIWGAGKATPADPTTWMLVDFFPGVEVCGGPNHQDPDRNKRVYFVQPPGRYDDELRGHYSAGDMNEEYDAENVPVPKKMVFGSRAGDPDGVIAYTRQELEEALENPMFPDGSLIDPTGLVPNPFIRKLDTHPEFFHVPANDPATDRFLFSHGLIGRVNTYMPRLFELFDQDPGVDEHWMLGVPCASPQLSEKDFLPSDPQGWLPDQVFLDYFGHAMVRVFDVHDTDDLKNPNIPVVSYTLLGPSPESAASQLEPLYWDAMTPSDPSDDRVFLFMLDFGGSVVVWDLGGLRALPSGTVIDPGDASYPSFMWEEWLTPECVSDDLPNNAWGLAVDRVQWNDGENERDEIYVYVAVGRVGIEVLNFQPNAAAGSRLVQVDHVETPYGHGGLKIRDDGGVRTLLFGESEAGIRILGYN